MNKKEIPGIFVTMTCNAHWLEAQSGPIPEQIAEDRSDLCYFVFRMKKTYSALTRRHLSFLTFYRLCLHHRAPVKKTQPCLHHVFHGPRCSVHAATSTSSRLDYLCTDSTEVEATSSPHRSEIHDIQAL